MILYLSVKKRYFEEIKAKIKKEEYRAITPYWTNKLTTGKPYTHIIFACGYNDPERIKIPYKGYKIKTIIHEFFGNVPTKVYAITL